MEGGNEGDPGKRAGRGCFLAKDSQKREEGTNSLKGKTKLEGGE